MLLPGGGEAVGHIYAVDVRVLRVGVEQAVELLKVGVGCGYEGC
jgi:hypothetical protein